MESSLDSPSQVFFAMAVCRKRDQTSHRAPLYTKVVAIACLLRGWSIEFYLFCSRAGPRMPILAVVRQFISEANHIVQAPESGHKESTKKKTCGRWTIAVMILVAPRKVQQCLATRLPRCAPQETGGVRPHSPVTKGLLFFRAKELWFWCGSFSSDAHRHQPVSRLVVAWSCTFHTLFPRQS